MSVVEVNLTSGRLSASLLTCDAAVVFTVADGPANAVEHALQSPLGLPPLAQCSVPGDRVVIVVEPDTPRLIDCLTAVWEHLAPAEATERDFVLLLPADSSEQNWGPLIEEFPLHIRNSVAVCVHDPADEQERRYLATSAAGERIYLSRHLVEADLIVTVGVVGFDSLLGYLGTNSSIYPAMSDAETIRAARGFGHVELTPDNKRPLRDLVDEVGWLLGTQFSVQVVPDSSGGVSRAFCGAADAVAEAAKAYLNANWRLTVSDTAELAIVSVSKLLPERAWRQVCAAMAAISQVVEDGGGIAVVADLPEAISPSLQMLRRCNEPEDLLKPLGKERPPDVVETTQLIHALQRHRIYLLSRLPQDLVEDLGMIHLSSVEELQRLADSTTHQIVVAGANFLWGEIAQR